MTKPDPNTIKVRAKLGHPNRKAPYQAIALLSGEEGKKLKARLVTASIMEGKSEADLLRGFLEAGLDALNY